MNQNIQEANNLVINRASRLAVETIRGGVNGVGVANAIVGARVQIVIDPTTGFPVEPDEEEDGVFFPGDYPGSPKALS